MRLIIYTTVCICANSCSARVKRRSGSPSNSVLAGWLAGWTALITHPRCYTQSIEPGNKQHTIHLVPCVSKSYNTLDVVYRRYMYKCIQWLVWTE